MNVYKNTGTVQKEVQQVNKFLMVIETTTIDI
jgi:hypothetical protein